MALSFLPYLASCLFLLASLLAIVSPQSLSGYIACSTNSDCQYGGYCCGTLNITGSYFSQDDGTYPDVCVPSNSSTSSTYTWSCNNASAIASQGVTGAPINVTNTTVIPVTYPNLGNNYNFSSFTAAAQQACTTTADCTSNQGNGVCCGTLVLSGVYASSSQTTTSNVCVSTQSSKTQGVTWSCNDGKWVRGLGVLLVLASVALLGY